VGRSAQTDGLGLDRAGVKTDERGFITVDHRYRTSSPYVHAIGDVKSGPLLAHKAMAEGIAVAEALAGNRQWRFKAIPSCVYTDPEVAWVGTSESEALKRGLKVKTSRVPLTAIGRSLTLGRGDGLCKMVVDAGSDRVLGVQMVAPEADALIAEATVAVELGLTAAQLGRVVHAHPTMSELLFEAAEAIHGQAVHVVNR
jgi:dihydrolipoamide dehydrogenase